MEYLKKYLKYLFFLLLGIAISTGVQIVLAHGGNTNYIHACVGTGVFNRGQVRMIDANGTCRANETPLDWSQYPWNGTYPLMCTGCDLSSDRVGNLFEGKDLTNAFLDNTNLDGIDFTNIPVRGIHLRSAIISAHGLPVDWHGKDFTGADLSGIGFGGAVNLSGAIFVNVRANGFGASNSNFSNINAQGADLTGVGLEYSSFTNANLTNVNFTYADLQHAIGLDTATRTGITWQRTWCPDTTNSDDNGGTCEGHLTPRTP